MADSYCNLKKSVYGSVKLYTNFYVCNTGFLIYPTFEKQKFFYPGETRSSSHWFSEKYVLGLYVKAYFSLALEISRIQDRNKNFKLVIVIVNWCDNF